MAYQADKIGKKKFVSSTAPRTSVYYIMKCGDKILLEIENKKALRARAHRLR
jgi:hypothetical protein